MAFPSSRAFGRALMAAAKTSVAAAAPTTKAAAAAPTTTKASAAAPTTKAAATSTKPSRRPTGIAVPKPISPALAEFLGSRQASRTDAMKGVWDYIKTKGLQNPQNKKEIICDGKLKALFGKDKIGFLEVSKLLGAHFEKTG